MQKKKLGVSAHKKTAIFVPTAGVYVMHVVKRLSKGHLRRRNLSMSVDISIKLRVNKAAQCIREFLLRAIQFVIAQEKSGNCKNLSYTRIFVSQSSDSILQLLTKNGYCILRTPTANYN